MGMSLNIQVNGVPIGRVFIRRLVRDIQHDVPNEYEYEARIDASLTRAIFYSGTVHHVYDDGALALIEKVMADIREGKTRDADANQ